MKGNMQMQTISLRKAVVALCPALTAALFMFAGCNNKTDTPPAANAPTAGGGAGKEAGGGAGKDLLAANCRCHNGGGGKAPDLSHIGSDPSHTAGWIAEYANDPKSKDPNSRMPSMQGKVSSDDLTNIAAYLASQK
jgi:mono/diheme cytochrome c family protein